MATVALVGTLDTKGKEFAFLAARLRGAGAGVIWMPLRPEHAAPLTGLEPRYQLDDQSVQDLDRRPEPVPQSRQPAR